MKDKVLEVLAKYCFKDLEEQKRMCKTMESAEVLNDLPEPLKTKENKRYSELKKDSKILKEHLNDSQNK